MSNKKSNRMNDTSFGRQQDEQIKQQLYISEAEIQELKESLRYVEIQLAKTREEKEGVEIKLEESQNDLTVNTCNNLIANLRNASEAS